MTNMKSPREITLHHVGDPRVDRLRIFTEVGPLPPGTRRYYTIEFGGNDLIASTIAFQRGPVCEYGPDGFTNEALLAIVADRLQGFQDGPMRCRENAIALTKTEEALHWLQTRTRRRLAAGVEGRGKP